MSRVLGRFGVAALVGMCVVAPVQARQHLVQAGAEWSHIASEARPGDEIILLPGRHRPAALSKLHGTAQRPIMIRSLSVDAPATIGPGRYGLELHEPLHVTLQDFAVTGASIAGILVDDGEERAAPVAPALGADGAAPGTSASAHGVHEVGAPGAGDEAPAEPRAGYLLFRRVTVLRTGPQGDRDAVRMTGVVDARFDTCVFEGWGGAAIELLACRDVTIENCGLRGLADHGQVSGVQIRAGSRNVHITSCRFERCGFYGVVSGGVSTLAEFRPPLAPPPAEPVEAAGATGSNAGAATSAPGEASRILPASQPPAASPPLPVQTAPPAVQPAPSTVQAAPAETSPQPKPVVAEPNSAPPGAGATPPIKKPERPKYRSKPRSAVKGGAKPVAVPVPAPTATPAPAPGPAAIPVEPAANPAPAPTPPPTATLPPTAKESRHYGTQVEAAEIEIGRSVFIDCPMPFAAIHADQCRIRNNTILRPQRGLLAFAAPHTDVRFARVGHVLFESNVIIGDLASLPAVAIVQEPAETSLFEFGQNLWWHPNGSDGSRAALANLVAHAPSHTPEPQVMDVDPGLDDQYLPTNPEAKLFGPQAP